MNESNIEKLIKQYKNLKDCEELEILTFEYEQGLKIKSPFNSLTMITVYENRRSRFGTARMAIISEMPPTGAQGFLRRA